MVFLTCSYLILFEIAISPPLVNRNSVQNHLNYPTEPQPITDSCHNNSLPLAYLLLTTLATPIHWPPNPSSLPTSNHRLCLLFLNDWSCQRHLTLPYPISLHTNSHKTHAPLWGSASNHTYRIIHDIDTQLCAMMVILWQYMSTLTTNSTPFQSIYLNHHI